MPKRFLRATPGRRVCALLRASLALLLASANPLVGTLVGAAPGIGGGRR